MKEFRHPDYADLFSRIKRMSFPQFKTWIDKYGFECQQAGVKEAESEGAWWEDSQVYEMLRAEKIGADRAKRIVDKLLTGGNQ